MGYYRRLKRALHLWLAPPVPADKARCEFDCRSLECTWSNYQDCPRRKAYAEEEKRSLRQAGVHSEPETQLAESDREADRTAFEKPMPSNVAEAEKLQRPARHSTEMP